MADGTPLATPGDKPRLPREILDELNTTVTALFERAIDASDASSSLERIAGIRDSLISSVAGALSRPMRVYNATLSLQNSLPAELWLDVWARLPLDSRVAVSHVCSRWRDIIIHCPDVWTAIDCHAFMWIAPDGSPYRRSTAGLVPVALERAKALKLSLNFFFDPDIDDSRMHRFTDLLAPHARNIAALNLTCTVNQSELLLRLLQPLSALERLVHGMASRDPYIPALPPIFECQFVLPSLKLLVLPHLQHYGWPDIPGYAFDADGSTPFLPMPARFPALQTLCFAPARDLDIGLAMCDSPRVTSLTLMLGTPFYRQAPEIDTPEFSWDHLTHVYLLDVPPEQLDWALAKFNILQRQYVVIAILDDRPVTPRGIDALPFTPDMVIHPPNAVDALPFTPPELVIPLLNLPVGSYDDSEARGQSSSSRFIPEYATAW
ncbi:hypothetical protein AURDEDRAFT_165961 [Auricularia subglabra TFB-10046 SS5]|nr:hypothetical protein AURDEDRAFT_165961 [Auricularia subglabra TFB-10046 SS5]